MVFDIKLSFRRNSRFLYVWDIPCLMESMCRETNFYHEKSRKQWATRCADHLNNKAWEPLNTSQEQPIPVSPTAEQVWFMIVNRQPEGSVQDKSGNFSGPGGVLSAIRLFRSKNAVFYNGNWKWVPLTCQTYVELDIFKTSAHNNFNFHMVDVGLTISKSRSIFLCLLSHLSKTAITLAGRGV